jgi:anti-sigma regulatory factor (Ser/Thr protein kinase)
LVVGTSTVDDAVVGRYRHEAFLYADDDEFMNVVLGFIREGVDDAQPMLVALSAPRIDALRHELGRRAAAVQFADMDEIGANPARIIPAWQDFLTDNADSGRPVRGIGEPIWAARTADELAECHRHEALLNVAFTDPDFWLLCPYDTRTLDESVIDEASRTHPFVRYGRVSAESAGFPGNDALTGPFDTPLREPDVALAGLAFQEETLRDVRNLVATCASRAGLNEEQAANLVLAAYEISANSVRHGGGRGTIRLWIDDRDIVCEVRDAGSLTDPMLGRVRPRTDAKGGRGLWIANQLCDLVQVRSFPGETVVRMRVRRD